MRPLWLGLALLGCHPGPATPPAAAMPQRRHADAPPDARKWYLEAVMAEVSGDFDRARHALLWVARLDRGSPWPQLALGRLAELAGDPKAARAAYEQAIAFEALPEAHLALGRLLAGAGDASGARASYDAATTGFLARAAEGALDSDGVAALVEASSGACRAAQVAAWLTANGRPLPASPAIPSADCPPEAP